MGIFDWIVGAGLIGGAAKFLKEDKRRRDEIYAENQRRRNTPFSFSDGNPNEEEFNHIVKNVLTGVKRIRSYKINGQLRFL